MLSPSRETCHWWWIDWKCMQISPLVNNRGALRCGSYIDDVSSDLWHWKWILLLLFCVFQEGCILGESSLLRSVNSTQRKKMKTFVAVLKYFFSFLSPLYPGFQSMLNLVEPSSVLAFPSQSVKLGLVSLCSPDWQRRVWDRPERHRNPIRSATLINLFKQTGRECWEKGFQPPSESH